MDKDLYIGKQDTDDYEKKLEKYSNKYYRAYRNIPRLQKALDHEREINHKLYAYALTLEKTIKLLMEDKNG